MQGKGLFQTLLAILLLVTLYQLFLLFKTNSVEQAGHAQCNGDKNCYSDYLDEISGKTVFRIPGVRKYSYSDLKAQQMKLGLDLKGGMSATLQVDLREHLLSVAEDQARNDETFLKALENAQSRMGNVQQDYLTIFGEEWDKISKGRKLGEVFSYNYPQQISLNSSTAEVLEVLRVDTKDIVKRTYNMLVERIDKLGVVQPNITLDEGRDLILAELPGVENPQQARDMLEKTANLEFYHAYPFEEVYQGLAEYDQYLKSQDTTSTDILNDTLKSPLAEVFQLGGAGPVAGTVKEADIDKAIALLNSSESKEYLPMNVLFRVSKESLVNPDTDESNGIFQIYALRGNDEGKPQMNGGVVTRAREETNPEQGTGVSVTMNAEGTSTWCTMTGEAHTKNSNIAIVLDGEVVSAPTVTNGAICGGNTFISGDFSVQEAQNLAKILEIGALPASPRIIQESRVGPTLGQENISRSVNALVIGFALVLLFMVAYYSGSGIVSIIALLANILFIFGALSSNGTVMTLPGVAGIVLTIGMAVDANVIIFERVREELRDGKSLLLAIRDGFNNSYSAIIDANITTLLTAGVLFYFGMGPVKGFAVVLGIGVIMSVITAVILGRIIIEWWTGTRKKNLSFSMGWSEKMFANLNVDWMGMRKKAYIFSGAVISLGIISMFVQGFDLGVEFSGGYNYTVQFDKPVEADALRSALATSLGDEPIVKTTDGLNTFAITTQYGINDNSKDAADNVAKKLLEGVNVVTGGNTNYDQFLNADSEGTKIISANSVRPTVSKDIQNSSLKATIAALLLIFLYIFVRFRKWQFSLGAVAALFHDVLFTLGLFSLLWKWVPFPMEIDQAFIAAILTVVGYSINDTVVVFDRIREYINNYTGKSKTELINAAVNSTVSRTIITSLTTLFVILMLFIFGAGSIKGFAFALLIGVLVGTYSSVFIATPVVHDTTDELKAIEKSRKDGGSTLTRKRVADQNI